MDANPQTIYQRYQDLQRYLDWDERDVARVARAGRLIAPHLEQMVDDFYAQVLRHPATVAVMTEGPAQVTRLRSSLLGWLEQLFLGPYDEPYVWGRYRVGIRHAEIGLPQPYTNAALARLRRGIHRALAAVELRPTELAEIMESVNKILDLDLAIIEESYELHRLNFEKLAERERSERKFRNLVEAAACMIITLNDQGEIVYFSPFAERLTGFPAGQVVGRSFLDVFATDATLATGREAWKQAFQDLPLNNCEMQIRSRDGSHRWLVWNALRLEDFDGETVILAVGHDITEKRRASARLLQAERLAAIGHTITGLAHESRNALQRINSCTEMLEFEVEGNDEAMQLIRRSQQAQDDLARLFDEVRGYAAPIRLERSPCELSHIWREAWQLIQGECRGRDVQLHETLQCQQLRASVDRFRLVQVFRNLFENSLAACSGGVSIQIACRERQATEKSDAASLLEKEQHGEYSEHGEHPQGHSSWLEVRVRDNGPGLDPRARREVFEPFFTTKTKGTGLGMAIARRVLEAHGGTITLGELDYPGAEFVLNIPRDVDT